MEFDLYFPSAIFVVLIVINLFGAVVAHLNNTNRIGRKSELSLHKPRSLEAEKKEWNS